MCPNWGCRPAELKKFKVVVADECHYLKSIDTKRTKALVPAIKNAKHKLLLSGTPAVREEGGKRGGGGGRDRERERELASPTLPTTATSPTLPTTAT